VTLHVRLLGPLEVTTGGARLEAAAFPGRQGRLVFAALALAPRPVDRNELADILWPNRLPSSWTRDLSAIVSKLRSLLADVAEIETGNGRWYALRMPADSAVDVTTAARTIEQAEKVVTGDPLRALQSTEGLDRVLAEPFLAGDDCPWVDDRRAELHDLAVRNLVVRADALCRRATPAAVATAQQLVDAEPQREQAYVLLMRAHLALGGRVDALRTYERLRRMLAEDFGLSPSPAAEELLRSALGPEEPADDATAPALPLPPAVVDARRTAIVGREQEVAALETVFAGSGARFALVLGPPGIGKSRLACEIAARAHERGCVVCYGACSVGPATPYRVIIDAFTSARLTPGAGDAFMSGADAVVELIGTGDATRPESARPRRDFVTAVATAVGRCAAGQLLLVLVDDLQWVDRATVRMLDQLLALVPGIRVIATARGTVLDDVDVAGMLARLRTRDSATTVHLSGLDRTGVAAALYEHGVDDVDTALVDAVHRATGGNPLYVREVGRHLAVSGRPQGGFGGPLLDAIGLPRGLAELIDANVARLGASARRVLEVSAVIGQPIELGVLARACGLPDRELQAAVEVTRQAGVLVDGSSEAAALRFDHPLVREVLLHGLGATRRAQLHQRIAEAIETYHHDDLDRFSAELAHHLAAAANIGSARDAIDFAMRAGERAGAVFAYDEAVHWYSHALRLTRAGEGVPATTARVLAALGDAQNNGGDARSAHATLLDAVAATRRTGDPEAFASVVLRLGHVMVDEGFEGGDVDERLVGLLDEALGALPPDSPVRARCAVRLANELHFTGDRDRCLALCADAERVARASGDRDALAAVLTGRHYALYGAPDVGQRLELLTEIQGLRTTTRPDPRWLRDYLELGDLTATDAAAAHLERQIATAGVASDHYYPAVWASTRAALRGDLDVAEAAANAAAEVGRLGARGPAAVAGVWAAQIFAVRLFDGRLAELRDVVDPSADATPSRPVWRAAAAFMHLELGDPDAADAHLRVLRDGGFARIPDSLDRPLTLAMLAWVTAEIGTLADVRAIRRALRPYQDLLIVLGAAAPSVCAGPVAYPLGLLEARLGRIDAATALLRGAELRAEQIGARRWRDRIRRARGRVEPGPAAEPAARAR
jgi:DNA-binding SARP family transcriptional activator